MTAGFVICFPNYSTFLAKHVEDIFARVLAPPWPRPDDAVRRRGQGGTDRDGEGGVVLLRIKMVLLCPALLRLLMYSWILI